MPSNPDTLLTAGDVQWEVCALFNTQDTRKDILAMCVEVNLYEDIFSHTMFGNLIVVDTNNIISTFPIVGQEKLVLRFRTPTYENVAKVFRVTHITDKFNEGNKQMYKINFISYDGFLDICYTENRALTGTSNSIIKNVHDAMWVNSKLPGDFITEFKPKQNFKASTNHLKLVSPQWSPVKCINWATKKALNTKQLADYLYYETLQGVWFQSLTENLFSYDPDYEVQGQYTFDMSRANDPQTGEVDLGIAYRKIHQINYESSCDQLTQTMNRAFGQKVYDHNLWYKKVGTIGFSKSDVLDKTKVPVMNEYPSIIATDAHWNISPDAYTVVANSYPYRFNGVSVDKEAQSENTRLPVLNKLEYEKVNIEVWGQSRYHVGMKVLLILGNYTSQGSDIEYGDNMRTTGVYLITAIHHRLSVAQHKMTMQCIRESSVEEIKPE